MNEILKKLNDRAKCIAETTGDEDCDYANECITMGIQIAIEIIQSEQADVPDKNVGKIKTRGDIIRESNESLAEYGTDCFNAGYRIAKEEPQPYLIDEAGLTYLNETVEGE